MRTKRRCHSRMRCRFSGMIVLGQMECYNMLCLIIQLTSCAYQRLPLAAKPCGNSCRIRLIHKNICDYYRALMAVAIKRCSRKYRSYDAHLSTTQCWPFAFIQGAATVYSFGANEYCHALLPVGASNVYVGCQFTATRPKVYLIVALEPQFCAK